MPARRPAPRRPGQIALVSVFALMTLLLLTAAIFNAGRVTSRKLDNQSAADAAAHAAGVELARGMNAITALNHLMAELNALDALVMSFGGTELEDHKPTKITSWELKYTHFHASFFSGGTRPAGKHIVDTKQSKSGASILRARRVLQGVLADAYRVHAAGGVLATEPILSGFRSIGRQLVKAAHSMEENVVFEWKVLDYLEELAEGPLLGLKHRVNPIDTGVISLMYAFSKRVVDETPHRAEAASKAVAGKVGAAGTLFPNTRGGGGRYTLEVPVRPEQMRRGAVTHTHSQMVRGMTPWVQHWRKPILDFGLSTLPLSEFAKFYHHETNEFTLNMAWWQWVENKTRLYVLKDLEVDGKDKGREKWATANGSRRADELFAVVGFAHQPAPGVVGAPLFRPYQPDGLAAHAQILVYNANRQDRPPRQQWQPVVGWDTLAWDDDVPEFEYGKRGPRGQPPAVGQPRVKLNWQTKLVPTTRLADAAGSQGGEVDRILGRTAADRSLANTH